MSSYIVTRGQTLSDIALEVYGDISGIILMIQDNEIHLGEDLQAGQVLTVRPEAINVDIAAYYAAKGLKANTGEYEAQVINASDWLVSGGVWNDGGFWRDDEFWIDNV
jgi:hypothetical protein